MSYEIFRNALTLRLSSALPADQLAQVLTVIDTISADYTFALKTKDLILFDRVPEAVRIYIAAKSVEKLSAKTLELYLRTLQTFFRTVAKSPDSITANDIRVYLYQYQHNRHVADCTIKSIRQILSGFFAWCLDEDLIRKNPVSRVAPIHCEQRHKSAMSPLELEVIRKACRTPREKAVVDFLYATAARVSEACAVTLPDIDWEKRSVLIRRGKGGKSRTVYLNAESVVSLRVYLSSRTDSSSCLFPGRSGKPLSTRAVQKMIERIISRTDVRTHVTPHIFRHTSATVAIRAGMPVEQVQRMLGHSSINTTMVYTDIDDSDVRQSHGKYVV